MIKRTSVKFNLNYMNKLFEDTIFPPKSLIICFYFCVLLPYPLQMYLRTPKMNGERVKEGHSW